jgi:hypothetical protein
MASSGVEETRLSGRLVISRTQYNAVDLVHLLSTSFSSKSLVLKVI